MEPVGDLDGVRRASARALGVGAAPIARDDLDPGARREPGREPRRGAIIEQVDRAAPFQVE
jgi:hypothetical protein